MKTALDRLATETTPANLEGSRSSSPAGQLRQAIRRGSLRSALLNLVRVRSLRAASSPSR